MISPENDEEFGPFGQSAVMLLDFIAPNLYKPIIIVSPSFNILGEANISPQFDRGNFFAFSFEPNVEGDRAKHSLISKFSSLMNVDVVLDSYRYEHAILANEDLSIVTAWAQAEYAVIAFKGTLLDEYGDWLESMQAMQVVRRVP